ncbi:MAG: hypothetical protein R3C14_28900 [Caldilineaceae bacterium]
MVWLANVYTLTLGGEYTIYAWAYTDTTGTYQFQIRNPTAVDVNAARDPEVVELAGTTNGENIPPMTTPSGEKADAENVENHTPPPDETNTIYLPLITGE